MENQVDEGQLFGSIRVEEDIEGAALARVVGEYLEGYLAADAPRLERAFHPLARLYAVGAGGLERTELAEWGASLRERKARGDVRTAETRILGIDVTGDAAVVKVRLRLPTVEYTDYLSALRLPDGWVIINKIYAAATP